MRRRHPMLLILGLLALCASAASAQQLRDAPPPSARELLDRAFALRFEVDLTSMIELEVFNHDGDRRIRRFEATSKRIDGKVHTIGRLVEPDYLRGMTILTIEADGRDHDSFLYLPSLDRVRRITTAHRGDAVFGTDVTYEDLERQRVEAFELGPLQATTWRGERAWLIEARPHRKYNYGRVDFVLAESDLALLSASYFKRTADRPYRIVTASRPAMIIRDDLILPTRLTVRNFDRGTRTEVHMRQLAIDPPIDDQLFSLHTLESRRPLPVGRR